MLRGSGWHAQVQTVYLAVYKHFMEAIDAIDNGVHLCLSLAITSCLKGPARVRGRLEVHAQLRELWRAGINQYDVDTPPRYLSSTGLSARVGGLNPAWNEDGSDARADAQFARAVQLTGAEFRDAVAYISKVGRVDPQGGLQHSCPPAVQCLRTRL
jgi:uncharacterized UPF0160 family protein